MEENWIKDYRVENGNKLTCKYCDKTVHKSWLQRHINTKGHKFIKSGRMASLIQEEIIDNMMEDFDEKYPDLTGKEREEKINQETKSILEQYSKAVKKGYFKNITEPDDFDLFDYEMFLKENI